MSKKSIVSASRANGNSVEIDLKEMISKDHLKYPGRQRYSEPNAQNLVFDRIDGTYLRLPAEATA